MEEENIEKLTVKSDNEGDNKNVVTKSPDGKEFKEESVKKNMPKKRKKTKIIRQRNTTVVIPIKVKKRKKKKRRSIWDEW